jgi:hypothetical protein
MQTKITLTVDGGLTEDELTNLRYLIDDALGEFVARRSPARQYVEERYPDDGRYFAFNDKLAQVELRNQLAHKLHRAALKVEDVK